MSTPPNVHQLFDPDRQQMLRHLEHLFGGDLDGCQNGLIEIAWTNPAPDASGRYALDHAKLFGVDELEEATAFAETINRTPFQNVYVGAALRQPDTPRDKRAKDPSFYALPAAYADLDDPGAVEKVKALYAAAPPTAVVMTGAIPHNRAQLWWRLEEPIRSPDLARRQNLALAIALGGDRVVVNPSRVMRLGGSIAWAVKPGRSHERTNLLLFNDGRPRIYLTGQLPKAFPPIEPEKVQEAAAGSDAPQGEAPTSEGLGLGVISPTRRIALIRSGRHWHDNMLALIGQWLNRGWQDEEILTAAEAMTLPGYTREQTRHEVAGMIRSGRDKWAIPEPEIKVDQPAEPAGELIPQPFVRFDPAALPRRPWILGTSLLRGHLTVRVAPGGVGKSILGLQEAIAVALGETMLTGDSVHEEGLVWVFNFEEPLEEQQRRIAAICQHFGIDMVKLEGRLFLNSMLKNERLIVAKQVRDDTIAMPDVERLIKAIGKLGILCLDIDPFVKSHKVKENDNDAIDFVADQYGLIAKETGCSIKLTHHTRKATQGEGHVGNADASRGASALVNAGRIAQTLSNMSEKDAEALGIKSEDRRLYVRLDDAKVNFSLPGAAATWFKRTSIDLPNIDSSLGLMGDQVGVLQRIDLTVPEIGINVAMANEIFDEIDKAWMAKAPYAQRGARSLTRYLMDEWRMPKTQANGLLTDWLRNEMLASEQYDAKSKATGLRVLRRPGIATNG